MRTIRIFFQWILIIGAIRPVYAQNSLNGVYAGIETALPTVIGQGMERTDRVFLFRPDGSFNGNLRRTDWRTAVTGRYTISGRSVTLQFSTGGKEMLTLQGNGDLQGHGSTGNYPILRLATDRSVPAGC